MMRGRSRSRSNSVVGCIPLPSFGLTEKKKVEPPSSSSVPVDLLQPTEQTPPIPSQDDSSTIPGEVGASLTPLSVLIKVDVSLSLQVHRRRQRKLELTEVNRILSNFGSKDRLFADLLYIGSPELYRLEQPNKYLELISHNTNGRVQLLRQLYSQRASNNTPPTRHYGTSEQSLVSAKESIKLTCLPPVQPSSSTKPEKNECALENPAAAKKQQKEPSKDHPYITPDMTLEQRVHARAQYSASIRTAVIANQKNVTGKCKKEDLLRLADALRSHVLHHSRRASAWNGNRYSKQQQQQQQPQSPCATYSLTFHHFMAQVGHALARQTVFFLPEVLNEEDDDSPAKLPSRTDQISKALLELEKLVPTWISILVPTSSLQGSHSSRLDKATKIIVHRGVNYESVRAQLGARSFSTKDKGSNRKTLLSSLAREEPTGKRVKASPDHSSLTSTTPVLHPKGVTPQQAATNGSTWQAKGSPKRNHGDEPQTEVESTSTLPVQTAHVSKRAK
eukprot:scaffold81137_cov52-Attheya_sp.AAC.2